MVPQVLVKDKTEMLFVSKFLEDFGYTEVNLKLGCPYPMVTNRGKEAGLLPHPDKIENILETFFVKVVLGKSMPLFNNHIK